MDCSRPPRSQREFALGTICVINLYESGNSRLYSRIFSRIREIDRIMSAFPGEFEDLLNDNTIIDPNADGKNAVSTLVSGVLAINRQAGIEPVKVRADLLEVLEAALRYADLSGGAFDPTIGPLVKLWGIGSEAQRVPANEEIAAALELVNWRDLIIDRKSQTVFLRRKGMEIDLGAIAKGYAGDEAARIAKEGRVKRGIIDLGGNIFALGWRNERGSVPWRIGVQNPFSDRGESIGFLAVHDTSVVTSGVYERFFEADAPSGESTKRYHHILSTANGYPVDNGLLSVTIVTERSMEADALSTAVFAMGYERGKALIDSIPNTEVVFVFADKSVKITEGLSGIFTLINDEFTLY
ncbi:MAG: FAD:protein FMN transferase [Treponema sp.]|nr:FAD:protein FMN transferase [Treponema sp.]